MRLAVVLAVVLGLAGLEARAQALKTEEEKTLYALGLSVGQSLKDFSLTPAELEIVKRGMTDSIKGAKPAVELNAYGPKVQELYKARQGKAAEGNKKAGAEFLAKAAKEPGAEQLPSGVVYRQLKAGTGKSPQATDTVQVHYRGTLINGTTFDSSYDRKQPAEFPLNGVIPCWTQGVQKMKVGGKAQLVCPSDTAYGEQGSPPAIPPGSTLVFEVELLSIKSQGDAPTRPGTPGGGK